jgi:hypothetical protein
LVRTCGLVLPLSRQDLSICGNHSVRNADSSAKASRKSTVLCSRITI